ncbi:hypothetical protein GCM10025867_01980 [Frondihabitans sucicola]|uniref:DUF4436 domain-containing protein n=1 Tax=Frondihabitans sucicola TaxID=1268041 RepID=A0ABN6XVN8_9MICO|nr:DUF4436 family protein [Frondihabitans sucicola]BDZ47957.1 hypothetical protein GCM10025867_01980 [Frondihabitans sucicola]
MTTTDSRNSTVASTPAPRRRNPAPVILIVAVILLAVYYVVIGISGALRSTTAVPVHGPNTASGSYLQLRMSVQDIDLTNRVVQANVLPIPHGNLVGTKAGEISKSLRIEVSSGGVTTSVVTFPGQSVVDATALTLTLDRGDTAYPFDQPFANFQLSVQNDKTGAAVPFEVDLSNSARPWVLDATRSSSAVQNGRTLVPVALDGHRDALTIVIVLFYVLAILFTTLMAVVTIGSAIIRRKLEFSNVIWLSATLLSFPALRSAMPGAPPIGTTLDFVFLFPCLCLVAIMFVWTGAHILWRESTVLRQKHLDDESNAGGS